MYNVFCRTPATGRLPECSDRLHTPRLIPKITAILITPTITIFTNTACELNAVLFTA